MADRKPAVFMGRIEGEETWRLFRTVDARNVRAALLKDVSPPEVEIRRPTIEEAMDFALDGIAIEDLMAPPPAADPQSPSLDLPQASVERDADDLNDPPRLEPGQTIDPETGEVIDAETGNPLFDQ